MAILACGGEAAAREVTATEGPGLKLTQSTVLHPAAVAELGYDSNVALAAHAVGSGFVRFQLRADWASRPPQRLPGVGVTAARQKIEFRLGLSVERRDYFSRDARSLSAFQLDEAGRLTVNPQGTVAGTASAQYTRTLLPRNFEPIGPYMRDVVGATAGGLYRTKRGRYEFGLGYEFLGDWFEEARLRYAQSLRHTVRLTGRKEVLPHLSVSLEVSSAFVLHQEVGTVLQKADSRPLTIVASAQGIIRPRLSATIRLGYVNGFYDDLSNLQNQRMSQPVAEIEATWQLMQTARLSGGYSYRSQDAITGNFYVDNLVYLRYDQVLVVPRFRSILGSLRAAYRHRDYHGLPVGYMSRDDDILQIQATIELPLKDWLLGGIGYDMSADFTGFRDPAGIAYRYVRHEVFGKVQVSY
ncbi:MAG: hypothetical protein HY906_17200 [Deltaproteobacteria bacterium]|nr:hypothetical protein [Deltaproteobacteria bacterium]